MTGRGGRAAAAGAAIALALSAGSSARAEQMRIAASTPSDLQRGEAQGIAVSSQGRLLLTPRITPFGKPLPGAFPSQVFSASSDDAGDVFLGTGPDGQLVRILRATGAEDVLFRADEPLITSVLRLPTGEVLAASAPGGKIYKVQPDGKSALWCETEERYVWALLANADGSVLAATGDRGRLLKIDRNGKSSVLFDGDETHLVSLAPAKDGGVWAGGAGRGLVYRIDREGHARVVYDDELPEARAIVVTPSGDAIVTFDAPPVAERRPPALRLRVAGGAAGAADAMGDLDSRQTGQAIQGVIEGLPTAPPEETLPLRGKVVRIAADGGSDELWRSPTEAPFAVALDGNDRPIFATGEPARLWRVDGPDEVVLLATLGQAQATAFVKAPKDLVVATSNPAAAYRLEAVAAESGTFLAPTEDAGSMARWGRLSWRTIGPEGRVEMFTRTGNCEEPDGTWSAWSPVLTDARGAQLSVPDGRYFQWRVRLAEAKGDGPRVGSVAATYATRNRPPTIRDLRVDPASGAVSGKATFRWSAADPDGDGVSVDIQARLRGTDSWKSAVRTDPTPGKPTDPTLGNDSSGKDGRGSWDTAEWDEGCYDMRAVASDQGSNAPSDGLEATVEFPTGVCVDRTPPSIEAKRKGHEIEVTVTDALSAVAKLEVLIDGRAAFSPRSTDGVCDSQRETFKIPTERLGDGKPVTLRATDAAGNAVENPVPEP